MKIDSINIGLITSPIEKSGVVPLTNLVTLFLRSTVGDVHLITGNRADELCFEGARVQVRHLHIKKGEAMISHLKYHMLTQAWIVYNMLLIRKNIDVWYFYFGSELLIFPIIVGKLTRKPVLLNLPNSYVNDAKAINSKLYPIVKFTSEFNCHLADLLIVASKDIIHTFGLDKYVDKISIANEYYVDSANFKCFKGVQNRSNIVGFVGRLNEVKGILNFIQAVPLILDREPDVTFFIGGDGLCKDYLCEYISLHDLSNKVTLGGWVDHEDLPECLNNLKVLVIPSYSEAGPIIAYEAMACGTPVIGTKVGCVLMNLDDGISGYLLKENSPECIAENVIRALNSPNLERVAENGRQFVEENFILERVVVRWKEVFEAV